MRNDECPESRAVDCEEDDFPTPQQRKKLRRVLCDWHAHFLPVASAISFDPSLERSRFLKRNQKLVRYVQNTHPCELLRRQLELNLEIDRFGRIHV